MQVAVFLSAELSDSSLRYNTPSLVGDLLHQALPALKPVLSDMLQYMALTGQRAMILLLSKRQIR